MRAKVRLAAMVDMGATVVRRTVMIRCHFKITD
jgi:hypothetical protein